MRAPPRQPPDLGKSPSEREALVPELPPPVTPRTLSLIQQDHDLLPRDRASLHLLHAIAEANDNLITAGIVARVGWDTELIAPTGMMPQWEFGGHQFVQSGAALSFGAVVAVTAPLSLPSNAVAAGGLAAANGVSLVLGARGEVARSLMQEEFLRRYGLRKEELKWSVVVSDGLIKQCIEEGRRSSSGAWWRAMQ